MAADEHQTVVEHESESSDGSESNRAKAEIRVSGVLLYGTLDKKLAQIRGDVDPLDFIRKREIPLYVRIDNSLNVALVDHGVRGVNPEFNEGVSFFRLSRGSIDDLQRADGATTCRVFECGGLIDIPSTKNSDAGYERISFHKAYAIDQLDKRKAESRAFLYAPKWRELALSLMIDMGNIYIEIRDADALQKSFYPYMREFPPALEDVPNAIRLLYTASYRIREAKEDPKVVLPQLRILAPKAFRGKALDEADRIIYSDRRGVADPINNFKENKKIDLKYLSALILNDEAESFLAQKFLTRELRAVILLASWWANYSESADFDLVRMLELHLETVGFDKPTVVFNIIKMIVGDTEWKGERVKALLKRSDQISREKFPFS
ncbi:hypothetical protein [Xanthomonas hortorum]|uniref:hypothetical protein n=1 Tax=Xanthomonas hortorum TaxID=56454 RepID=UPI001594277E|nr:hypothetical protein [Xanthomonas hortorum]NHF65978.1 hypothetical protein [Xanthomonas hortorum]